LVLDKLLSGAEKHYSALLKKRTLRPLVLKKVLVLFIKAGKIPPLQQGLLFLKTLGVLSKN
jgi:hypothetical protein